MSRDPLREAGGINLYSFISNAAVNQIDFLGLAGCDKFQRQLQRLTKEIAEKQLKIRNIHNDIKDRLEDLSLDVNDLLHAGDDPSKPDSETRRGHWDIINRQKANLARRRAELQVLREQYAEAQCAYAACEKAEKEALKRGAGTLGKKCAAFVCRKTPLAIILFACDAYGGGVCHAANEFTWPVSELWTD